MGKKKNLSPQEERELRAKKAEKKRAARKRKTNFAALMGAMFSFVFVGTVLVLLFKIKLAMNERDNQPVVEPYRGPAIAVTELTSSSEADKPAVTTTVTTTAPAETTTTTTADPLIKLPGEGSGEVVKKKVKPAANSIYDLGGLQSEVNSLIAGFDGEWQVYLRHTESNREFSIDTKPVFAANIIRLCAAGAAYQKVADGTLKANDVETHIRNMIENGDNDSFAALVEKLGQDSVTEWCRQQGYWDTVVSADATVASTTSALDAGRFLNAVYRGEMVNRDCSAKLLGFIKALNNRDRIPAGTPSGTETVNITGEGYDICHDAAIVYCDTGDYVLVVMGDTKGFGWSSDNYIIQVSELIYKYFNGDPNASDSSSSEDDGEGEEEGEGEAESEEPREDDSSAAE